MSIFQKGKKGASKLTLADVAEIRRLYGEGYTQSSIGQHFRVAVGTIGRIVRGESWLEGAGTRELSPLEHEGIQKRVIAQQEQMLREKAFEAETRHNPAERASPPVSQEQPLISDYAKATRDKLLGYDQEPGRASPSPSLLDGGDAPADGEGQGLARLEEAAQAEGLDVEAALKRSAP